MRRIAQIKLDRYSRDWQSFSINQDHRVRGFKTIRLLDIKRSRKKALFFLSPLPLPSSSTLSLSILFTLDKFFKSQEIIKRGG